MFINGFEDQTRELACRMRLPPPLQAMKTPVVALQGIISFGWETALETYDVFVMYLCVYWKQEDTNKWTSQVLSCIKSLKSNSFANSS